MMAVAWVCVVLGLGCSSAQDSSGSSSSSSAGSGPGGAGPTTCGAAPWVDVKGTLTSYFAPTMGIEGAAVTCDLCPGVQFTTDHSGVFAGRIAKGVAFNPRVEASGFISMRIGEEVLAGDLDSSAALYPVLVKALAPDLTDNSPAMLVLVVDRMPPDPADVCAKKDGYVISVKGHPEAIIRYYGGTTTPTLDPSLTSTGPLGATEVGGLPGGTFVELDATKPGCSEGSFVSYPHNGRYFLENGVLTLAGFAIPPAAAPL